MNFEGMFPSLKIRTEVLPPVNSNPLIVKCWAPFQIEGVLYSASIKDDVGAIRRTERDRISCCSPVADVDGRVARIISAGSKNHFVTRLKKARTAEHLKPIVLRRDIECHRKRGGGNR